MAMEKDTIIQSIQDHFAQREDILFAYLYGSFAKEDRYRDIDLAIYSLEPDLIKLGSMRTDLIKLINIDTDLTYLNDLPQKNPAFGYEVVTKGELFYNTALDVHNEYKVRTLLAYFDTVRLRDSMNKAFLNRLRTNNFGERNYA